MPYRKIPSAPSSIGPLRSSDGICAFRCMTVACILVQASTYISPTCSIISSRSITTSGSECNPRLMMSGPKKAIVDAFRRVIESEAYLKEWILDEDFVKIICLEYGLECEASLIDALVRTFTDGLRYDSVFKSSPTFPSGGVSRREYRPLGSKRKKNDHEFHNACLEEIVCYYQLHRKQSKKAALTNVKVWTDNCGGQYKCRQNFWKVASFAGTVFGVAVTHQFSQKYDFKGVWDAAGKVVKNYIRKLEEGFKARLATPWMCYLLLRRALATVNRNTSWEDLERTKDPLLIGKGNFVVSKRFFGFVTDDAEKAKVLKREYLHIVYSNRVYVPTMSRIKDTLKLHSIHGGDSFRTVQRGNNMVVQWKLYIANMPCPCLACRGLCSAEQECLFKTIRGERVIWVHEKTTTTGLPIARRPVSTEDEAIYERISHILNLAKVKMVTIKTLNTELRLRNLSTTGNKPALARRLLEYCDNQEEDNALPPPPLATNLIADDTELDPEDEDSDDEEDEEIVE
jgi:hypothetical protein